MIGPVDSYQSIYVAQCGQQFPNYSQGSTHEKHCPACAQVAEAQYEEDNPPPEACEHCGKELEDMSDIGCGQCDQRSPEWGIG